MSCSDLQTTTSWRVSINILEKSKKRIFGGGGWIPLVVEAVILPMMFFMLASAAADPIGLPVNNRMSSPTIIDTTQLYLPLILRTDRLAACNVGTGCAIIHPGETIKIGMGGPMTGDLAPYGIDASQAAQIAVEDAGSFQSFNFELAAKDDGGTPTGGAAVANNLSSNPTVVAVAGHIFSGASQAAIPIYEKAGIPMMSPLAMDPSLTQQGSKVFNRLIYTDDAQGRFAARFMYNKLGIRKLAIMYDGWTYGQGVAEAVQSEFLALGGQVTALVVITPGQADYSTALSSVASKNPEALYYGGYLDEAATIVNQMDSAGLSNVIFVSDDAVFGQDFILRTGANGEGAYSASIIPHSSPALTAFNTAYEQRYQVAAGSLSPITWYSYDAAASLIFAIKKVAFWGSDGNLFVPRSALVTVVRTLTNYQGISGVVTCSAAGECNSTGPTFNIVQGGKWVEVP